jgi:hypothetical protein
MLGAEGQPSFISSDTILLLGKFKVDLIKESKCGSTFL